MNKSSLAHLAFLNLDRLLRWTFKVRQVLFTEPGNYKIPSGLAGRLTGFLFDSKLQKEYTDVHAPKDILLYRFLSDRFFNVPANGLNGISPS